MKGEDVSYSPLAKTGEGILYSLSPMIGATFNSPTLDLGSRPAHHRRLYGLISATNRQANVRKDGFHHQELSDGTAGDMTTTVVITEVYDPSW